jgi:DNA processing protein
MAPNRPNFGDPQVMTTRPGQADYPAALLGLPEDVRPAELHVMGEIPAGPCLAIVGTRNAPPADLALAASLAGVAVRQGLWILSGGALGIDAAAHRGALEARGRTVALVGGGLADPYPAQNRPLFAEMIGRDGALVSLDAADHPPLPFTFPRRNRVVAGWAVATLVVAAPTGSGALITARHAAAFGRPLAAVPGSAGADEWITRGATPVRGPADLSDWLGQALGPVAGAPVPDTFNSAGTAAPATDLRSVLTPQDQRVLALLGEHPLAVDELGERSGLGPSALLASLVSLELAGLCQSHPGPSYARSLHHQRTTA